MELRFTIPVNGKNYRHKLLNCSNNQIICYEGVIFLGITKRHNHSYEIVAYIYKSQKYIYPRYYKTKTELYGAVQKLLQEEL